MTAITFEGIQSNPSPITLPSPTELTWGETERVSAGVAPLVVLAVVGVSILVGLAITYFACSCSED